MALNLDRIAKHREDSIAAAARRAVKFYEFRDGRNILRIAPPWEGSEDISRKMGKHWGLGPEGKSSVFCPKVCYDLTCPICSEIDRTWKSRPDEDTKTWLKRISAGERHFVNVLDMKDTAAGWQVAEFPKTVMDDVWNVMVDPDVAYGDISDPNTGRDIIIDKTGSGIGTRYAVRAKLESTVLDISVLGSIPNLDALVKKETTENLRLIFEGKEPVAPAALPAPPVAPVYIAPHEPAAVPPEAMKSAGAGTSTPALPECYGKFNEDSPHCLDECPHNDVCEIKTARAAKRAAPAPAAAPAPVTKAPAPVAKAPVTVTPPSPPAEISTDELMREMEEAINR